MLAVLGSSLEAAHDAEKQRLVEVRAGGIILARSALLIETEQGFFLRLRDLEGPLPGGADWPAPVPMHGEVWLPLGALAPNQFTLDLSRGALSFSTEQSAEKPAYRYRLEPADDGAVGDLLWLDPAEPFPELPGAIEPATGPEDQPYRFRASEGKPAPGPVRRRDPVEEPLLETEEWREWLLSVVLNGQTVSEGALFILGPEGQWAARVVDLRAWRVRVDESRIITFNGEPFFPLDALDGASQKYDPSTLTIALDLPPDAFEGSRLQGRRVTTIAPQAGRGAFFDYDVLYLAGEGVRERLDSLLELGLFDQVGVLVTSFRAGDVIEDEREFVRLDTTFTRDLPERRASFRLGDSLTGGGALGRPVRFAGMQISSNFATDPTFVTFPLPTIGGLAEQPSVVEVLLENTRRVQEEVPPGPFEIESLPVVTGAGELQLRVTDLLGREQLITQSYYVSPRLLRAGLSDYSYELGFERESFNEDSFDYGDPLLVGTHRYGLTDALTLEGRGEASAGRQALGAGSFLLLGDYGLLSAGVVGSRDGDDGLGAAGLLEYEYRANRFSVGLRTRLASDDFRQLGLDDEERARRVDQLSFGLGLYPYGRLGLLLVNAEGRGDFEDQQSVSASYSLPLGFASVLFSALRTIEPERDLALVANLSIPLAPSRSLTASAQYRGDDRRGRLEYRRSRGSSDLGPSYRLATELGDDPQRLDGTLRYDAALASGQLDLEYGDGEAAVRGNLEGSLALIDGKVMASRRLGPAFGMVALPGYPDITVYLENREAGRTDDEGYLLLPRLNPYQENRVRIRSEDLPLTAEIASDERIAVPYARSGVQVGFEVKQHRTALATLLDARGDPLPAGLQLASEDGRASAQVADRGLAYVKADAEGPFGLASVPGQPVFRCELPPLPDEPMAALGEIRCR